MYPADLYEHVRQETGRGGTPSQKAIPKQPSMQQPSSPAIAAVPAAPAASRGPYTAPGPAPAASPAPRPSYQDFESESESSVSTTPGKSARAFYVLKHIAPVPCCCLH